MTVYTAVFVWVTELLLIVTVEAQLSQAPSDMSQAPSVPQAPSSAPSFFRCGCADCTEDVWKNSLANGFSCGIRISFAINVDKMTEHDACIKISTDFPDECGAFCNPNECASTRCGCQECTDQALNQVDFSTVCRNRIEGFKNPLGAGLTELDACLEASQYCGFECGSCPKACNPLLCDGKGSPICSCTDCELDAVVDPNDIGQPTCEDKLLALWYEQLRDDPRADREVACQMIAQQYPLHCGKCHPDACGQPRTYCGCLDCTEEVWQRVAEGHTCGSRIRYVAFETPDGNNQPILDACRLIADEYPSVCGPECDPDQCIRAPTTPAPTVVLASLTPTLRATSTTSPTDAPSASSPPSTETLMNGPTEVPVQRVPPIDGPRQVLPTVPPSGAFGYTLVSSSSPWLFLLLLFLHALLAISAIGC